MKTLMNKITARFAMHLWMLAVIVAFVATASMLYAGASKNATGTTDANVVFGPQAGEQQITAIDATSDLTTAKVTVRVRTNPADQYNIDAAGATDQAKIHLDYVTGLASNDYVVVCAGDSRFAPYRGRIIIATTTNITLDANLTSAVASGDKLYELRTVYTSFCGSNSVSKSGAPLVSVPADSPVVVQVDGTAACEVSATVK